MLSMMNRIVPSKHANKNCSTKRRLSRLTLATRARRVHQQVTRTRHRLIPCTPSLRLMTPKIGHKPLRINGCKRATRPTRLRRMVKEITIYSLFVKRDALRGGRVFLWPRVSLGPNWQRQLLTNTGNEFHPKIGRRTQFAQLLTLIMLGGIQLVL